MITMIGDMLEHCAKFLAYITLFTCKSNLINEVLLLSLLYNDKNEL